MAYHDLLGLSRADFASLENDFTRRTYDGLEYRFLPNSRRGVQRGTVLLAGAVVAGYPSVPRTLVLSTGVPAYFDGPVAIEEKLNGYNVRLARVDGRLLAFTRSGLVCPFTTRRVERTLGSSLETLFDAHPDALICGEVIGPENPYTVHDYPEVESLAFRAFDWRDRASGTPLPVEERRERCETYGVPQTPLLGTGEPAAVVERLPAIVDDLDRADREGVVLQSLDGRRQLKYTTSAANRGNLAYAFSLPFEYGREFVFQRLMREAFQSVEWEESPAEAVERADRLGEAILLSTTRTIGRAERGGPIGERHTVRERPETVARLLEHLREQGLSLEIESDRRTGADRVVTFVKRSPATRDKVRGYLDGQVIRE